MTNTQMLITFVVILLGTVFTRFIPYILFPAGRPTPPFVKYLGRYLAPAVFALLVVYCLKNVDLLTAFSAGGTHGIPEMVSLLVVIVSFLWKKSMILSMAAGTLLYMLLVQLVF